MLRRDSRFSCGVFALITAAWASGSVLAQCSTQWLAGPGAPGTNGPVYATTMWDPDGSGPTQPVLVVGGGFTLAGTVAASNIATYDSVSGVWSALGTGMNGWVLALATLPNGDLVAAGAFTSPGNYIARWDGTSWSALGTGTDSGVTALTTLPNGDLVAGGSFATAGGVSSNRIARWDGTTWHPLGAGVSGGPPWHPGTYVSALTSLPNGNIVAGGRFTTAGSVLANDIARWDGTNWHPLGSGMSGFVGGLLVTQVLALTTLPNGQVLAGGDFINAGSVQVNSIARWDGTSWWPLGSGIGTVVAGVRSILALPNGNVLAGGSFPYAGAITVNKIARFDGTNWSALGSGVSGGSVHTMTTTTNGDLAVGGNIYVAGGLPVGNLAQLTTTCPATVAPFGAGCTGSGGLNVLTATTLPWAGSTFSAVATGMPASALALGVLGLSTVSIPISSIPLPSPAGCTLLVSPDLLGLYLPTAGSVQTQVALPNSVALAGQVFHEQVVPLELSATGSITAVTSTNALTVTIGSF